jgi:hypothetical protein
MVKLFFTAAAAAILCAPHAAGQSLLQRGDWQDRKFETYLPKLNATVPWLELDTKTKRPKGDFPLGRDVGSGRYVRLAAGEHAYPRLHRRAPHIPEHVAMLDEKWIEIDGRQPGMRRILEALRQIEEEAPGLLDEAALAASELHETRSDGGLVPQ